jgi:hypothetical protein
MSKNKILFLLIFAVIFFVPIVSPSVLAATPAPTGLQYTLLEKIPGFTNGSGSDLPGYIKAVYNVALAVIVLSAVLMLSIGGFMYLTSAGNTSAMGTAKGVIFDSLIGLVIALTAWLLLSVINPDLVTVSLNGLSATPVTQPIATGIAVPPTSTNPSGAYTGTVVAGCRGCVDVNLTGVPIKSVTQGGCKAPGPCKLNEVFLNKLKLLTVSPAWWVTEAWPPTVTHSSSCHADGTCADINFQNGVDDPASVKTFYTAIKLAGFSTVYETFKDCKPYSVVGVPCSRFSTTTGSHFHVY